MLRQGLSASFRFPMSKKPRILDLFCGAGGATRGLQQAGFYVVGVDNRPQPHYVGDEFHCADAMTYPLEGFDAYWASPPCQRYSVATRAHPGLHYKYPDLVADVRLRLQATHRPYIIENVPGAPLVNPLVLCGTMFGLRVKRHRLFECSFPIYFLPASCSCRNARTRVGHHVKPSFERGARLLTVAGDNYKVADGRIAMGISWMNRDELSQAIPPAYSRFLGEQMMRYLNGSEA